MHFVFFVKFSLIPNYKLLQQFILYTFNNHYTSIDSDLRLFVHARNFQSTSNVVVCFCPTFKHIKSLLDILNGLFESVLIPT